MPTTCDGPASKLFAPVKFTGNATYAQLAQHGASAAMADAAKDAPEGSCVCQGIRFEVPKRILVARHDPVSVQLPPTQAQWLLFIHCADLLPELKAGKTDVYAARRQAMSGIHARLATYVLIYADGTEAQARMLRKRHLSSFTSRWGNACSEALSARKARPIRAHHEQTIREWGWSQTRVTPRDSGPWVSWICAWKNPHPEKKIIGLRVEPAGHTIVLSAISAGKASDYPLRWETRRKALVTLPRTMKFDPTLDGEGLLQQIQLDLGQVISAQPQPLYDNYNWATTYNNQLPQQQRDVLIEYASHPDAVLHLPRGRKFPVASLKSHGTGDVRAIPPSDQRVTITVVDQDTGKPVAVKLHVHGAQGEYLAPR